MAASRSSNSKKRARSILAQRVNMRKRFTPALPKNTFGNFAYRHFLVEKDYDEEKIETYELADNLKKGMNKFSNNYMKEVQGTYGY